MPAGNGRPGGERLAIMLRGGDVGLHPLLLGALLKRAFHVKSAVMSMRAGELPIDEDGTAKILASGSEVVGGDQAINDRLDRRSLFRVEKSQGPGWALSGGLVPPGQNGSPPLTSAACATPDSSTSAVAEAAMTSRRWRGGANKPSCSGSKCSMSTAMDNSAAATAAHQPRRESAPQFCYVKCTNRSLAVTSLVESP
jgi:hypothetical protein